MLSFGITRLWPANRNVTGESEVIIEQATSLAAMIKHITQTRPVSLITIEDPIEYHLDGITQIQVHPRIGLSFAAGLRSMLRHDPDVMMVGEIRDLERLVIAGPVECFLHQLPGVQRQLDGHDQQHVDLLQYVGARVDRRRGLQGEARASPVPTQLAGQPNRRGIRIRCAELEMGRNSVKPCTKASRPPMRAVFLTSRIELSMKTVLS